MVNFNLNQSILNNYESNDSNFKYVQYEQFSFCSPKILFLGKI